MAVWRGWSNGLSAAPELSRPPLQLQQISQIIFPFSDFQKTRRNNFFCRAVMDTTLRTLLPAKTEKQNSLEQLRDEPQSKETRRVSLACNECQKRRSKVVHNIQHSMTVLGLIHLAQCSGTLPCTRCVAAASQCIYDPKGDRRRKAHVAELSKSHDALCRVIAKLRSDSWDDIVAFLVNIQSLPTDQAAIEYISAGLVRAEWSSCISVLDSKDYPYYWIGWTIDDSHTYPPNCFVKPDEIQPVAMISIISTYSVLPRKVRIMGSTLVKS